MKNIEFFRISLTLVGLLCSGGQAINIVPLSGKEKNIPNFTALDKFGSKPMQPMLFNLYTGLFKTMVELFDSSTEVDTGIVKRTARNANTDRTKLPENINVTIKYNNVTESQTQTNIYYSMTSNSTPIHYLLANNNTKQNNDTYVNKFNNLSRTSSTWPEYSTLRNYFSEQYNKIVKKLYTVYTTLLPRSLMASIVLGIRKYWLFKGFSVEGDIVLYVSLVIFCGMLLFVAFITIKSVYQLLSFQRKLKKEDFLMYMV